MMGFLAYPDWEQNPSARISVSTDAELYDSFSADILGRRSRRTGRIRVIVEGEEDLVLELLGKNFTSRLAMIGKRIKRERSTPR